MDNFIFRGRDIAEFGAVAAFGDSMHAGAKISRSEYKMPGGGSAEIGEATYEPTTRVVRITPEDGKTATPAWRRSILAWLQGGRGELVEHNDPEVYRIAQFDTDGTYEWRSWPTGLLQMTMTLQPFAYALQQTRAQAQTTQGAAVLALDMETQIPAPVSVRITPQEGTVTAVTIECGGESVTFEGLNLGAEQTLCDRAGDPLEADASVQENVTVTFAHVTRWAQLPTRGSAQISVYITGGEAQIEAWARCRWPA